MVISLKPAELYLHGFQQGNEFEKVTYTHAHSMLKISRSTIMMQISVETKLRKYF